MNTLGNIWAIFGPCLDDFGASTVGNVGAILELSSGLAGATSGPPWDYLESGWGYVGIILGTLGALLSTYSSNIKTQTLLK